MLFFSWTGIPAVFTSALLMGIGAAFLVVQFGILFSTFEFATLVLNAGLAFAIGFIGADILTNWVASPISGICACLMPVLMMIVFLKSHQPAKAQTEGEIPLKYIKQYIVRLALSMAFLGVATGAFRIVCGAKLLSSSAVSMELVVGVGCMVSVAVLVFAIALSKRTEYWDSLLRSVAPVIVLGIAGIALLPGNLQIGAAFFTIIGFACIVSMTWILLASFANNLNGSHVFIFGLGYGITQAASILGVVIANFFSSKNQFLASLGDANSIEAVGMASQLGLSELAVVLVVVFSFGYALLPRYRELKEILISLMVALSEESLSSRAQEDVPTEKEYLEGSPSQSTYTEDDGAYSSYSVKSIYARPERSGAANPELAKPNMQGADQANFPLDGLSPEGQLESLQRDMKGSFTRRCEEISEKYSLSAREEEVFFLLAKGHNAAFLTDKLCISRSTAKTHINHIYKKLGIHTQQELLNMVEERHRGPLGTQIDRPAIQDALRRARENGSLESNPSELVKRIGQDIRQG